MQLVRDQTLSKLIIIQFQSTSLAPCISGKLPIQVEHDDVQQAFTMTALELPHDQPEEERKFNNHHDEDESAPPLPPKPLAG